MWRLYLKSGVLPGDVIQAAVETSCAVWNECRVIFDREAFFVTTTERWDRSPIVPVVIKDDISHVTHFFKVSLVRLSGKYCHESAQAEVLRVPSGEDRCTTINITATDLVDALELGHRILTKTIEPKEVYPD